MEYTRRDFGKLSLATLPAAALLERSLANSVLFAAARPNSVINGVQVGTITSTAKRTCRGARARRRSRTFFRW
jgi:hypothetical protein